MTRTPTLPATDKSMWRKAIARAHPDAGGSHELCVWMQAVRDVVCGGGPKTMTFGHRDPKIALPASGKPQPPLQPTGYPLTPTRTLGFSLTAP